MELLKEFKNLKVLGIDWHGNDLSCLKYFPLLEELYIEYPYSTFDIESVKYLTSPEKIRLAGLDVKDLGFLGNIPEKTFVELCGIRLTENPSLEILKRFAKTDICEIYDKNNNTLVNTLGKYV